MKAIVYTKYGAPSVLQIKEIEKPIPEDDEVLIKIQAVEATKADCELRRFNFAVKWFWLPLRVAIEKLGQRAILANIRINCSLAPIYAVPSRLSRHVMFQGK